MKNIYDIKGMVFNNVVVLELCERKNKQTLWKCQCHCGNIFIASASNFKSGISKSCGCKSGGKGRTKNSKTNIWVLEEFVAIGKTFKGDEFIIDFDDYDVAKEYCWRVDKLGYVVANSKNFTNKTIKIHRLVTNADKNQIIDHSNQIKTDNRKSNLRVATKSQNNSNIKRKSNNTSGYTGVKYEKRSGKWKAQISINNKRIHLGTFDCVEDAVVARRSAEVKYHAEFDGEIVRLDYEGIIKDAGVTDMEEEQSAE